MMERFVLTDAQWAKMEPHCLGKKSDPGRSGGDNRLFVEAVLWIARTGSPWRDLPPLFGKWNTVFKRFRDWVKADVFARLFEACADEPDRESAMVDEKSAAQTSTVSLVVVSIMAITVPPDQPNVYKTAIFEADRLSRRLIQGLQ